MQSSVRVRTAVAMEGQMRGKRDGWTESSTGQSRRVCTDQRREAEIGSFWLEENRKEEGPTAAWGQVIGRRKKQQHRKKIKNKNQRPIRETETRWWHHRSHDSRVRCCWSTSVTLAALHIPSAPELPISWLCLLRKWTVKEAELHVSRSWAATSHHSVCMEAYQWQTYRREQDVVFETEFRH